jgi:hypothetical protein
MKFTYDAYKQLISLVNNCGYHFTGYTNETSAQRPVIMRHDVDFCLQKAVSMAELEDALGVKSTYFVLLSADLYNVFSARSYAFLRRILQLGHEIGLHFDELRYPGATLTDLRDAMVREAALLEQAVSCTVKSVSMHRPSALMLSSDLTVPGLVNSYSKRFFSEYKYVSDSRMRWREDVMEIVSSYYHDRLHILTHPFWYSEEEETAKHKLVAFIAAAGPERRNAMEENFTALGEIIDC